MNHFIEDIEKMNYKEIAFQPTNHQLNQLNHVVQVGSVRIARYTVSITVAYMSS